MLTEENIINILKETNVLMNGHFVLSSGRHADKYLQCAQVLQHPKYANQLASAIKKLWKDEEIDVVIGPAMGGIVLSYAVGQALEVRSIFAERKNGEMKLRRNFEIAANENILLVEDVVTTGGSVREVIEVIEKKQGNLVGISSLVDRSGGEVDFGYPFKPLVQLEIQSYDPDDCELCEQKIPITKPGSRDVKKGS